MTMGNGEEMAAVFRPLRLSFLITSTTPKATLNETVILAVPGEASRILSWLGRAMA